MVAVAALAATACAVGEAFDDRIIRLASGRFERVSLGCQTESSPPQPGDPARPQVALLPATGPPDQRPLLSVHAFVPTSASGEFVGEVFGQGSATLPGGQLSAPFPLGVEGPPLALQLTTAARDRLATVGVFATLDSPRDAAAPTLELQIDRVWVESLPGGFFELTGHLVAEVRWSATLRDAGRDPPTWRRVIERRVERRVVYAYSSDHQKVLRDAWCAALDEFQEAARSELAPRLRPSAPRAQAVREVPARPLTAGIRNRACAVWRSGPCDTLGDTAASVLIQPPATQEGSQ